MMTIPNADKETLKPVGSDYDSGANAVLGGRQGGYPLAEGACLSYWLEGVRNDPLIDFRSTAALPDQADVVVIGSGATGTLIALELLKTVPNRSVVLVEAREFCSGATGRNAGHCRPDVWRGFPKYSEKFGISQALKILQNEKDTLKAVESYIQGHNVDCEFWVGQTLDVMMTEDVAIAAQNTMRAFKEAGGDTSEIHAILDPGQAELISRVKGARAVYSWKGATLYPWKLVAHMAKTALEAGLNLQTWTPVTSVAKAADSHNWSVKTHRGNIDTPVVIHATNAYAPALVPEAKGAIQAVPHMCNRVIPPTQFAGSRSLRHSYNIIYPDGNYTVNPRQGGDGLVLVGGTPPTLQHLLDHVAQDPEKRSTDDSLVNFRPVTEAVKRLGGRNAFGWDESTLGNRAAYTNAWSGIIGESADMLPLIGELPGKAGQWICAGHNGHGMARIFTSAPGLVKLINGEAWESTRLPEVFQITEERLAAGRLKSTLRVDSAF